MAAKSTDVATPAYPTQAILGGKSSSRPRIVLACSYDPLGLQGPLQVWLHRLTGLPATLDWVGYGMLLEAMRNPKSAWNTNSFGINTLLLRWSDLDRIDQNQDSSPASLIAALSTSCAGRSGKTLVIVPPTSEAGKTALASDASSAVAHTGRLGCIPGVTVLAGEAIRTALDHGTKPPWHSAFLDRVAHAPYSPSANSVFASLICRELSRTLAPKRKAFCLDCDNTLWGGACSEVGAQGVLLSEAFLSVQRHFLSHQMRGALLCLVSRNDVEDVRRVLRERAEDLVLKAEHIVAIRASLDISKGDAVIELARTLSLDPASFVFVDDSARECADVACRCAHLGVAVVQLPRDATALPAFLDHHWFLEPSGSAKVTTVEDAARTALYRELEERSAYIASGAVSTSSMDAFTASLNLVVDITAVDAGNARRAAQLTDRANQHNACKCAAAETVLLHASATGCLCEVVDVRDRFGHHGLVGFMVADASPMACPGAVADELLALGSRVLHVRAWLLSCRSLYLGIEHSMMRHLANSAAALGATHLGVHWVRSERNEHAADFLFSIPGAAFAPMSDPSALGLKPLERQHQHQHPRAPHLRSMQTDEAPSLVPSLEGAAFPGEGHAVASAAEAAVRAAVCAGRCPVLDSLPPAADLDQLPHTERRLLTRHLVSFVSRAREGELSSPRVRAEVGLVIRGRIGGELCRHARTQTVCARGAACPFVHPNPTNPTAQKVTLRIQPVRKLHAAGAARRAAAGVSVSLTFQEPGRDVCADGSDSSAAERAEAARLRDVVGLSIRRAQIPNKLSNKILRRNQRLAPPHPPHQGSSPSEHGREEDPGRPSHGVILIPVASAQSAAVSFDATANKHHGQPLTHKQEADASAVDVESGPATRRPGFHSSAGLALHYETVRELAEVLASDAVSCHTWVAEESDRTHQLPDAFREVWAAHEPVDDARVLVTREEMATGSEERGNGKLDAETLQARLRQRMRRTLHDVMQRNDGDLSS